MTGRARGEQPHVVCLLGLSASSALANTLTVATTTDNVAGSLRNSI